MKTRLEKILEIVSAAMLAAIVVLLSMQVFTRYVAKGSLLWAGEMAEWLFVWMTFIAAVLVFRDKGHIVIDIVFDLLPEKVKKVLTILTTTLIHVFLFVLLYYSIPVVKAYSNQTATSVEISKSFLFVSLPVSALLMLTVSLLSVVSKIWKK